MSPCYECDKYRRDRDEEQRRAHLAEVSRDAAEVKLAEQAALLTEARQAGLAGYRIGRADERAAIVAWLRRSAEDACDPYLEAADEIQRGRCLTTEDKP